MLKINNKTDFLNYTDIGMIVDLVSKHEDTNYVGQINHYAIGSKKYERKIIVSVKITKRDSVWSFSDGGKLGITKD